jgi:hypothetical protein
MQSTSRILISAALFAVAIPSAAAIAQAKDPAMGTWVLNVEKSTYTPGPGAKSQTRTYAPTPNGYKFSADAITESGEKSHTEFTATFDGKFHALSGNPNADLIMIKRVDANTVESTQKRGGKEVIHTTRTVSKDGQTMTSTANGIGPDGRPYTNHEFFEKSISRRVLTARAPESRR